MQRSVLVFNEKIDRIRIKNRLRSLGVKVRHDSGGRVMVIDSDRDEKQIPQRLPKGVSLMPADKISAQPKKTMDHNEEMFLKSVKLRSSEKYRAMKAAQVLGESPEEQLLMTGY